MSRSRCDCDKIEETRIPNGGWGWMVVLGAALTNMCNQSLISVFGLLFGQHLEEMGHETSGVALVSNVNNMVMCFSGLVTGPILSRYSCRTVSLIGSMFTTLGLFGCSFATSITEILIYYSFFTGLGLGLIYPSSFVAIKSYFTSRRGRAVGISMAGTGIGQMMMPQLVRLFLDEYGFAWTIRIVAALCLHGVVGSLLFQPVKWHLKPPAYDSEKLLCKSNNNTGKLVVDNNKDNNQTKNCDIIKKDDNSLSIKNQTEKLYIAEKNTELHDAYKSQVRALPSCFSRLYSNLNVSMLLDPSFVNLCIGIALVHTSGVAFGMIFPFLLMESPTLKFSRTDTALCMSIFSAADIVARLTVPTITFYMGLSCRTTFMWGALLLAGARSVIALQETLYFMIAAAVLCGYIRAITVINQNLTVSEHCGLHGIDDKLPSALGLMMVCKGICVISFGQLLGWLRDYTHSFTLFIYGTNVLLVIVFISWFIEFIINRFKKPSSTPNNNV